ncbi:hypothetical protein IQ07DRAFT_605619 [Pyrenochaeta sp. DS3sAY3a]|nr:hypothetical protein IQ07DRAFT_605619 [Pyrenochaeta sp. DS3sAY3a]
MRSHAPEKHHGSHARGAQGPAGLISPSYGIVLFMHWGPGAAIVIAIPLCSGVRGDQMARLGAIAASRLARLLPDNHAVPLLGRLKPGWDCALLLGSQILKRDTRPAMLCSVGARRLLRVVGLAVFEKAWVDMQRSCDLHGIGHDAPCLRSQHGTWTCNVPSEAFAVGCGESLGRPRLSTRGHTPGTEPSTLFRRR